MKILLNEKVRKLFSLVILYMLSYTLLSVIMIFLDIRDSKIYILLGSILMNILILIAIYKYFNEQDKIMEDAIIQIKNYISGEEDSRIECDEEGELYRLFHEVNSLVSILNAHAQNEEKSKKFLKNTISNISHQLKTPIAALNIYNGIMQEEVNNSQTMKEFIALSEEELDRIEVLVQSLLKIAKLDSGSIVLEKSTENVLEMIKCIEKHFLFRAKQEEKELCLSGDSEVTLFCDRNWIIEAISNIVKNALDHTEEGNTVSIEWKQLGSMVQVIVRDNGKGIHPEDLYHIFKRFYRSRFSKDKQGIGLGLSLTKSIVEAHNGTIEVSSKLGIGTTFTINFLIPTKM